DPCTGAGTTVVALTGALANTASDMKFRPTDKTLFAYQRGTLVTIDTGTGVVTSVGLSGLGGVSGNAIAFSPLSFGPTVLYHGSGNGLATLDQTTGAAT